MKREREVDAVIVGLGWAGGILAAELTKAGLEVVALERGPDFDRDDVDLSGAHDEMLARRRHYTQDIAGETWTLRHDHREAAMPLRQAGPFTPGTGVGGSSLLYGGHATRMQPYDFTARSSVLERYGPSAIPPDSMLADWGMTYDELEPYYDRFEQAAGIGGQAGNLQGTLVPGGNPFEGPRSREFPVGPMRDAIGTTMFKEASERLGWHPYPITSATLSEPYVNPDGVARPACTYCGFCIGYPCRNGAKADATSTVLPVARQTGRLRIRAGANAFRVVHDGKRATGVLYRDEAGAVHEQPAGIVVLAAYALNNVRLLLLSGMGEPYDPATGAGVVGRNYSYNFVSQSRLLFADRMFKSYMGSGATGYFVADHNADNFDHTGLGFVGGGLIWAATNLTQPMRSLTLPPGTPRWGAGWKRAIRDWYDRAMLVTAHGEVLPYRGCHLDLDPRYRDAWGEPLLRITFDWQENERRMHRYLRERVMEVVGELGADHVVHSEEELPEHFDTVPYQSTHNTGGAIMGDSPQTSVVNPWLQMWDFDNVWVVGGSAFPHSTGTGPTGTIGALAYRAADAIVSGYVPSPGPLA